MRVITTLALTLFAAAAVAQTPPAAVAQVPTAERPAHEVALIDTAHALPPATPHHAASSVLHGVTVRDPYRWLERADDPVVREWIAAQNTYTEAELATMPQGADLTARVRELAITSTTRSGPTLAGGTLFYMQQTPPQAQPVLIAQAWLDGAARTLIDPNGTDGSTAVVAYWPSPSGRDLA
jgi:prolyl oligopeptidase